MNLLHQRELEMGPAFEGHGDTVEAAMEQATREWWRTLDDRARATATLSRFTIKSAVAVVYVKDGTNTFSLRYTVVVRECKRP
jgi:hypothetical protein